MIRKKCLCRAKKFEGFLYVTEMIGVLRALTLPARRGEFFGRLATLGKGAKSNYTVVGSGAGSFTKTWPFSIWQG